MPALRVLELTDFSENLLTLNNLFVFVSESISLPVSSAQGAYNVIRLLNWFRLNKTEMKFINCIRLLLNACLLRIPEVQCEVILIPSAVYIYRVSQEERT